MSDNPQRQVTTWEFMVATRRFQHRLEVAMDQALEAMALTFAQYRVLELLAHRRPIHVSELARAVRVTRQAMQMTVERLARGGLVDLERDGTLLVVGISSAGRQRLRQAQHASRSVQQDLDRALTAEDRAHLTSLIRRADKGLKPPSSAYWWLD